MVKRKNDGLNTCYLCGKELRKDLERGEKFCQNRECSKYVAVVEGADA